ncbi:MAG: hypothetical protein AAF798_20815 [Bacteroidota bacterium]
MYNFLTKNGQTLAFVLGVVVAGLFLVIVLTGVSGFSDLDKAAQYETGIFDLGLYGAIFLAVAAAVAMVGFGLTQIATNFKGSMKGIIGFAILIVIFLVSYSMASGEATPFIQGAIDKFEGAGNGIISAGNLKYIGGGITTAVVLVLIAAIAFIGAEIGNFFK